MVTKVRAFTSLALQLFLAFVIPSVGCCLAAYGQEAAAVPVPRTLPLPVSLTGYTIKASDVTLPADVPAGKYRRIIQPYPNWTLICDENLKDKKRVCNVSQQIVDGLGKMAFSWSLAGTSDGRPVMILRTPASAKGTALVLSFPDKAKPIRVLVDDCDANVCVAMLPVGPRIKGYIQTGVDAEVSYLLPNAPPDKQLKVVIKTTFSGLSSALAAI